MPAKEKALPRLLIAALTIIASSASAFAQDAVAIRSEQAIGNRFLVAVPDFATAPGKGAIGIEMAQVLAADLAFSELFAIVPRPSFPNNFVGFTKDPTQINFPDWKAAGAEFLVHAYVTVDDAQIVAECRLFDVATGLQVVGKVLNIPDAAGQRRLAHKFSEEVIRYVDGTPGIATSQICFSGGATGGKEIYIADYDGANARPVTKHGSISILPKFDPQGDRIAYLSYKDRFPFLYIFDLKSGVSTALSKEVGLNVAPAWAPSGQQLALVLSKDANSEIYLVNADGSNKRRLTNDPAVDTSPTFSPDGNQIAFVSERAGTPQIFAMGLDGGNVRRLSFQGGRSYDPAWSPDGESVAYVAQTSGEGMEIYVVNVANPDSPRRVTNSNGTNEAPCWSADSRHVIFVSTRTGRSQLWTVHVDSGAQRAVPNISMEAQGPDWGPRRP